MDSLDLWIEFVYSQDEVFDKYLIDVDYDDSIKMRQVKYTINTEAWAFHTQPRLDIFAYLYDIYNVMLF